MFDSNLNWVKVTVERPEEVARVHAVISNYLARDRLREPIDDVIVIPFTDRRADDGVEAVQ
jgi:hypothetical protein